jgi:predicted TIM-barrel fold metal-dependent hydrolase
MFYSDTALSGSTPGLMCSYAFWGADHMLFGTDMPFGGPDVLDQTIRSVQDMEIPYIDKQKTFEDNIKPISPI